MLLKNLWKGRCCCFPLEKELLLHHPGSGTVNCLPSPVTTRYQSTATLLAPDFHTLVPWLPHECLHLRHWSYSYSEPACIPNPRAAVAQHMPILWTLALKSLHRACASHTITDAAERASVHETSVPLPVPAYPQAGPSTKRHPLGNNKGRSRNKI